MPDKLCILQNADFEGPGLLLEWAASRGLQTVTISAFTGAPLPNPEDFSHLALLGSPNSVSDISTHTWIQREADLARASLASGKKILGICFGAQLLTHILGGTIEQGPAPEIGWHPFEAGELSGKLFQWHGECITLPPGASPFGRSPAYPLQGWRKGHTLAIGAHPEITPELVSQFIARCWSEEWHARQRNLAFIHLPARMLADTEQEFPRNRTLAFALFDQWVSPQ